MVIDNQQPFDISTSDRSYMGQGGGRGEGGGEEGGRGRGLGKKRTSWTL